LSPLVQRTRASRHSDPTDQHWSILAFESLSAGIVAVVVGLSAVLIVVGLYVIIVWPLTFWDLANLGLERYSAWVNIVLWSVFAGGSLGGYWCFSGAAFKGKAKVAVRSGRSKV
jgi:hypothetical protein